MDTDLCGSVGLVAGTALICANALFLTVKDSLNGVVYAAKVGGLDLDHMAGLVVSKELDVLKGVAPLVGNELNVAAAAVKLCGES